VSLAAPVIRTVARMLFPSVRHPIICARFSVLSLFIPVIMLEVSDGKAGQNSSAEPTLRTVRRYAVRREQALASPSPAALVAIAAAVVLLASEPYNLPPWALWLTVVSATIAGGAVVFSWVQGRFFPWRVWIKERADVVTGDGATFNLRMQVRARGGLTVEEITVGVVSGAKPIHPTRRVWRGQHKHHRKASGVEVAKLVNENEAKYGKTGHGALTDPHPTEDGFGLVAELKEPYFRPKGGRWGVQVTIRAENAWEGHLRVMLPSRDGRAFYYLPLNVRDRDAI
jgi:hypothetical protein